MIRPLATLSAGTLVSRLSGFLRDPLISALFVAGFVAHAFLFAFQFFNAVMIAAVPVLLFVRFPTTQAALVLGAVIGAAGCVQLIFLGVSGTRYASPVRFSLDGEVRNLFGRALPGMIAQSGAQLFLVA